MAGVTTGIIIRNPKSASPFRAIRKSTSSLPGVSSRNSRRSDWDLPEILSRCFMYRARMRFAPFQNGFNHPVAFFISEAAMVCPGLAGFADGFQIPPCFACALFGKRGDLFIAEIFKKHLHVFLIIAPPVLP